jgi:predicted small integral membrane protein
MTGQAGLRPGLALAHAFRMWGASVLRLQLPVLIFCGPVVVVAALLSTQEILPIAMVLEGLRGIYRFAWQAGSRLVLAMLMAGADSGSDAVEDYLFPGLILGILSVLLQSVAASAIVARLCGAPVRREVLSLFIVRIAGLTLLGAALFFTIDYLGFRSTVTLGVPQLFTLVYLVSVLIKTVVASLFWLGFAAIAVEDRSVPGALRSALALSKGSRIRIAAVLLLIEFATQGCFWFFAVLSGSDRGVTIAFRTAVGLVLPVLKGCILAAVYVQLCRQKQGPPVEEVSSVFG